MIWCVDDDPAIRDIEVYTLESTGLTARGFGDGQSLFAALETEKPELIVLDIMLPGEDGVAILRRLRADAATQGIPVIMATARGSEMDKIQSLNLGADDYLVKPFGVMEMVARVKAVLRRCGQVQAEPVLSEGDLVVDARAHIVTLAGQPLTLTLKEFDLLTMFLQNPGIVLSRDRLLREVWDTDYMGETRTVDMHVKTLRQKLGAHGAQIKTVIGVGYRWEAEA